MTYKYTREYFQIYTKIKQEFGQIQLFLGLFREAGRKSGGGETLLRDLTVFLHAYIVYLDYLDPQTNVLIKRE